MATLIKKVITVEGLKEYEKKWLELAEKMNECGELMSELELFEFDITIE